MGYTHYWEFNKVPKGKTKEIEALYQKAVKDCQRVIKAYYLANGGLSGYSAHTKLGQYAGIELNGSREEAHEPFILRDHYKQNESFNFCKTAMKPYDVVVVACLIILKHYLKNQIEISSDGNDDDFEMGNKLVKRVLKFKSIFKFDNESNV